MAQTNSPTITQSESLFKIIRSFESFEKYLARANSMRIVSYCTSPQMLLELFKQYELNELEVIVGEKTDFREIYICLILSIPTIFIEVKNPFSLIKTRLESSRFNCALLSDSINHCTKQL